jgi:uncharacterized protein (DUF427 family)
MKRKEPILPEAGQESVWAYPRPPRLEPVRKRLRVIFNGVTLADTTQGQRVLETSHPPVYYFPLQDVAMERLRATSGTSICEWKGSAHYYDVDADSKRAKHAAWAYHETTPGFIAIKDHLAFYAHLMDACFVGEELARPQPGFFYGGWITKDIVGPFKGERGTEGW